MRISVFSGSASVVWQLVCSIQPLFNVFFQNYLGATAGQLGLLVAIIQLAGAFQILGIFLYGWLGRKKPIFMVGHLFHRALTAIIAFVAFYVARGGSNARGILVITVAMGISWCFANASSACWWGWVADLFPESMRGEFFLRRSSIIQIVNIVWFFVASTLLDIFPRESSLAVFGVIISVGAFAGLLDIVSQAVTPEILPDERPAFEATTAFEPLRNRSFVQYAVAIGLATFSMNLIGPFQSPYIVNPSTIGAPTTWLGIMSMLSQLLWVICAPFWGAVMDRWGRKPVVIAGTCLVLGWLGYLVVTPGNYFIVLPLVAVVSGFLSPAFWEGSYQMMLSLSSERNRVSYVAWYLAIVALVSAPGSLAGGLLSDALVSFRVPAGPLAFGNFHVVQLLSILLCLGCAFLISRVREGSEKPFGFVVGQLANPQIFKTYQGLAGLGRSGDARSSAEILRSFSGEASQLAVRDIVDRLDDPDATVQEEAARALGRIPSPQSVDALILHLLDHSSAIRAQAARSLGRIGDRKAVGALVGCLWEEGEELQKACVEALAEIGDEEAIDGVMRFLRESRTEQSRLIGSAAASRLGVYEAAWEIFPALLAAKTHAARKRYAIAMANLLGRPGEFYQYVSGSTNALVSRRKRLFARFQGNVDEVYGRLRGRTPAEGAARARLRAAEASAIRAAVEGERNEEALRLTISFADGLCADIFGEGWSRDALFRVDQKLGIFAWMTERARRFLDEPGEAPEEREDAARTVVLLAVYFLSEY